MLKSLLPKVKIPTPRIFTIPDEPIKGTTQNITPVAAIVDNLALFKDGGAALVLESTSLNFGLLSEQEQEAVIVSYAALINSLSFTVQIMIRTQRKDVSRYLEYLDSAMQEGATPELRVLMQSYKSFIAETIKTKKVLEKRFFVVIPFSRYELGISRKSLNPLSKDSKGLPYTREQILKKAKIALYPKRDHLIRQAGRLGIKMRQITSKELVKLYHDIYNPDYESVTVKDEELFEDGQGN